MLGGKKQVCWEKKKVMASLRLVNIKNKYATRKKQIKTGRYVAKKKKEICYEENWKTLTSRLV